MRERRTVRPVAAPLPVRWAAWLGATCLLLVCGSEAKAGSTVGADLITRRKRHLLEVRSLSLQSDHGELIGLWLLAVAPEEPGADDAAALTLTAEDGANFQVTFAELERAVIPMSELVRLTLAPLNAPARAQAISFLALAVQLVAPEERSALSEQLFETREGLRERLPVMTVAPDAPLGAHVDRLLAVDEQAFFVEGWMHTDNGPVARLTAVSPEGERAEILDRVCRSSRPDVTEFFASQRTDDEHGMLGYFELESPSLRAGGWIFEVEDQRGNAYELEAPVVIEEPLTVRNAVLTVPAFDRPLNEDLMVNHVHPAITRVQQRIGTEPVIAAVTQLGEPPDDPDVSIIVPIYKRIDHLEAQLAGLADDPDILASDLVYVLDTPEQGEELRLRAADLYPIYRIPLRVAVLEKNVGFAGACNAGAELAGGRLLLFMNSDVLPDRPGWLATMRDFYNATPNIGALGPKLMYEDESIQHAGMYYHRIVGSSAWVDSHYFKGMHRSLAGANVARRVPLVSGACLMIDRALYQRLDGLPTRYVQGDYEDSDFCLQLAAEGLDNWYLPDAELYHLEGQSYAVDARRPCNRFNMWLHNHLYSDRIDRLMLAFADGFPDPSFNGNRRRDDVG
jgi:GT2 family glycosyltransferase